MPNFVDVLYATDHGGSRMSPRTALAIPTPSYGNRRARGPSATMLGIVRSSAGHEDLWDKLSFHGLLWPRAPRRF